MNQQDLVYRLRTCAAAILAVDPRESWVALVSDDAANLMVEAANLLDEPLGEPMAKLETGLNPTQTPSGPTWTTNNMELPAAAPRPCPACGEISARRVDRVGRRLLLTCPGCKHQWEYGA